MALDNFVQTFSDGNRDSTFGKLVQHIDQNLDGCLSRLEKQNTPRNAYVLIDLGNIHNVLQQAEMLSENFTIYAFADRLFNGFGANPKCSDKVRFIRAQQSTKNAADIQICWVVAQICIANTTKCIIHILTKDKGFLELGQLAKLYNHELYFHTSRENFYGSL